MANSADQDQFASSWNDNTLPLWCGRQINMSKVDEICSFEIPNQISTINTHTRFGENPLKFKVIVHPKMKIRQDRCMHVCLSIRWMDTWMTNMKPYYLATIMWKGITMKENFTRVCIHTFLSTSSVMDLIWSLISLVSCSNCFSR